VRWEPIVWPWTGHELVRARVRVCVERRELSAASRALDLLGSELPRSLTARPSPSCGLLRSLEEPKLAPR